MLALCGLLAWEHSTVQQRSRQILIGFKVICIPLVGKVLAFPILQSPRDVALIFRTCQLHTAWELLHGNGGSERPAAWHGQLLHWQDRQHPENTKQEDLLIQE